MPSHGARHVARLVALAAVAGATGFLCVAAAVSRLGDQPLGDMVFLSVPLWFLVPGTIVVLRRDGHMVGWLLAVNALLWAIQLGAEGPGGGLMWISTPWRAWINEWIGYAQWADTVALFVVFPNGLTGRAPAQRRTGRITIATPLVVTAIAMLTEQVGGETGLGAFANPTGLRFVPEAAAQILILPVAIAGVSSVAGLWRRARHLTGVQRRQYTWVKFAFSLVMVGLATGLLLDGVIGDAAWLPIVIGWFAIPTAFSIAILRHRLYDIDRIVSRTVAYAVVTIVIAGIYAVPVITLPELFDLHGPLPVAAATLAAAAAFAPVRRRVQRWVDRYFNRARVDARRQLDAFANRLRSQVELNTILSEVDTLVHATLQPRRAAVWIRPGRRTSGPN